MVYVKQKTTSSGSLFGLNKHTSILTSKNSKKKKRTREKGNGNKQQWNIDYDGYFIESM